MIIVKPVSIADISNFRVQYLLGTRPPAAASFPGDFADSTIHLAGFADTTMIGIASFLLESHRDFTATRQYRLRQMATATHTHGSGYGKIILQTGLNILKEIGGDFIWCHARQAAFGFYEKLGFRFYGDTFDVPVIGQHKIMFKHLK